MYYYVVRGMDQEQRQKLDHALLPRKVLNDEGVPYWWGSDQQAEQEALAAARALGFNVDAMMQGR